MAGTNARRSGMSPHSIIVRKEAVRPAIPDDDGHYTAAIKSRLAVAHLLWPRHRSHLPVRQHLRAMREPPD